MLKKTTLKPFVKSLLTAIGFLISSSVFAQKANDLAVTGRVFEVHDPPIPLVNVSIIVDGQSVGTYTDSTGNFTLENVPENAKIIISAVGYKRQDFIVKKDRTNLIFSLEQNVSKLDEVVITGFGKQKVREVASAVSIVNMENVINKPIVQLSQALQGATTGINVQQTTGLVGGDQAQIRIRGIATVGDASPLVLVDGIPFDMNNIDPNTVSSITVLKDAAAVSMYGSRGANGVILITTKRGIAGKVSVDYNGYYGIQKSIYRPDFVDAATWMKMKNEVAVNGGGNAIYSQNAIDSTASGADPIKYPNTDWTDLVLRKSIPLQQHSLMVSGGNTAARFVVAINHTRQLGQLNELQDVPVSIFSRTTVRINTTVDLAKNLFVYTDFFASRSDQTEPYASNRLTTDIYRRMYTVPPNVMAKYPTKPADQTPDYIPSGYTYYGAFGESWNPLAMIEKGGNISRARDQAIANIRPQWKISPSLTLNGQASYNVSSGLDKSDQLAYTFFNYFTNRPEGLAYSFTKTATNTARSTYFYWGGNFDYKKEFGLHSINAILGYTQELQTVNSWDEIALRSYFVKGYYNFNEKYLLEVGVRRDGSSLFGPGHKWGNFPSVAVAWNIDKESFFKIDEIRGLKLRASYGIAGNNKINPYLYQSAINSNGTEQNIGNPNIMWEKAASFNIGTDIFLKSGFNITADWFDKKTTNVLITPSPFYTGGIGINNTSNPPVAAMPPLNVASIDVKGFEVSIKYTKTISKDFQVNSGLGYTKSKSKILKLVKEGVPIITQQGVIPQIMVKGQPFQQYYGYRTQGLLQENDIKDPSVIKLTGQKAGDIRFMDLNGNGIIDDGDRAPLGTTQPTDIFFGNVGFNYKGFDFDALVSGQGGTSIFYTGVFANPFTGTEDGTPQKSQTDTWRPDNINASLPRLVSGGNLQFSDFWKRNGTFLRVRYLQVGYTIPKVLSNKIRTKMLRIYFNAQNPITFSSVKLVDPESGGTSNTVPLMKTFTFGLNVKF